MGNSLRFLEPALLKYVFIGFGVLFLAAAAIQCTRALVRGAAQEPGARRQIGRSVSRPDDPRGYWTVVGINAGGGLLLGGACIGLGFYVGRRKRQGPAGPG